MHDQTEALELFFDRGGEITCLSFERYAQEVDNGRDRPIRLVKSAIAGKNKA